ncbi:C-type lectin domain-containing protein [Ruminococcus callidus]|uniref:C-type lectin domain-containing protein n=1 Tax=Ruminococcus callidus TaxID=40519 RepID=UPI003522461D
MSYYNKDAKDVKKYISNSNTSTPKFKYIVLIAAVGAVIVVTGICAFGFIKHNKTEDNISVRDLIGSTDITTTAPIQNNEIENDNQELDYTDFSNHSYQIIENSNISSFEEAEEYCQTIGGHLATIQSQEENDYIYSMMISEGYKSAYFGFTDRDIEGTWVWVNDEPVNYTNWAPSEPNSENSEENYAMFYYKFTDGTWNDGRWGSDTTAFICEWDELISTDESASSSIDSTPSAMSIEPIEEKGISLDKIDIQQISDKITEEKESKKYEFTTGEAGTYRLEFSDVPQNVWFKLYLYNASMEQLSYESGDNGDGITADLEAGTKYYFVVEQGYNTGSYTLNIGPQKPTIDISTYTSVDDSIQFTNQRNIYFFTSTEAGTYRFELSDVPQNIWFKLYLYNASMEQLSYESGDNGDGITADLDANTEYYFVVEQGYNTGSYTLNIGSQRPAIDISTYKSVDDSTQFTNQRNIYSFTSSVAGSYRFELSNISQDAWFKFYLYNSSMEQLEYGSGDNGDGITADLDANKKYYFVVEQGGNIGSYTLNYGLSNE